MWKILSWRAGQFRLLRWLVLELGLVRYCWRTENQNHSVQLGHSRTMDIGSIKSVKMAIGRYVATGRRIEKTLNEVR